MEEGKITIVFFIEFPEYRRDKELYCVFKEYGEIDVVVIPPKRDKRGTEYGFVCFFNVRDIRRLVVKLNNIFNENKKLYTNILRFQKSASDILLKADSLDEIF